MKKHPEGIALLSMYNDDEDEEEENNVLGNLNQELQQANAMEVDLQNDDDNNEEERVDGMNIDSNRASSLPAFAPSDDTNQLSPTQRKRKGRLAIVDYAHDEVTMSPEHEEPVLLEESLPDLCIPVPPPELASTEPSEVVEPIPLVDTTTEIMDEPNIPSVVEEECNLLHSFLPPRPTETCSADLQRRIEKFLALKKVGRSYNAEVRNRKDYRNPDFLLHAVRYQDIDQTGSCFSKEVFDPHGYDKSDYYDEIELDMQREREKKEQELKQSPKVEFTGGGIQPPLGLPKFGGLPASVSQAGDGRQNKKSKWDTMKVESDIKVSSFSSGFDSSSPVANSHGHQKKRNSEEKKGSDRRIDRKT